MNKQVVKKIGKIAGNVVMYLFLAICIFAVVLSIFSKRDSDGTATVFGKQMRLVLSNSMEKCDATDVSGFDVKDIPTGSMVFVETVPEDREEAKQWYADLKVGDVLTFKYVYVKQETITHRIVGFSEDRSLIYLEGDNKDSDGNTLTQTIDTTAVATPNYVIGKVVGQSYLLGLFMQAINSPVGLICIVIVPSFLIIIYEILKILRVFGADKRRAEEEEKARQQEELADLRRRLAELEEQKPAESPVDAEQKNQGTNGEQP